MMEQIYEWVGFTVFWAVAFFACVVPLVIVYARFLHGRFATLGGKNKRQLSIASWHESVSIFKGERQEWQVDDYPFAWVRGLAYRLPWSGRSFVFVIGATDKARFHQLSGKTHPREHVGKPNPVPATGGEWWNPVTW